MRPMKNRRMPRLGRFGLAVVGLATVAVAAPLAGWMTSTPIGAHWSQVVDDTLTDLPQPLKVLQLVYAYLAIPTLVLAFAVLCWLTYRRSRRAALTYAAVMLLTNLSVQFVKLAPLGLTPSSTSLDPLSGHVGVAAGVVLGWLLVAPVTPHLRSEVLSRRRARRRDVRGHAGGLALAVPGSLPAALRDGVVTGRCGGPGR